MSNSHHNLPPSNKIRRRHVKTNCHFRRSSCVCFCSRSSYRFRVPSYARGCNRRTLRGRIITVRVQSHNLFSR
ncbi:hypothetical protein QVD17_20321 [Tagetes erecta]|uniref:Uncharacterized protein n=1 Tax=Tagetes erecta TaxID=13708 RepID=A0AAD8KL15_TARER|nr:hypothetical protein QVD17_20321 [Tagetes erecta]